MPIVQKVNVDELTNEEREKLNLIQSELGSGVEYVILGQETYAIGDFAIKDALDFAPLQEKWRKVIADSPNATMADLLQSSEHNLIQDVLEFLGIDVDPSTVTMKQFKWLMWIIAKKNYIFTELPDSHLVNVFHPFSIVQ